MDETYCKYVGSFALLKSATHRYPIPVSDFAEFNSSWYLNIYSGCILHVCPPALSEFVKFLPEIKVAFKLLTNNSDWTIPDDFKDSDKILDNPFVIKWYAQNCIGTHEKLVRIPIGLDYHSMCRPPEPPKLLSWLPTPKHRSRYGYGYEAYATDQESELISFNRTPFWYRQVKLYANFQYTLMTTIGEKRYAQHRRDAIKIIPSDLVFYQPLSFRNICWKNMSTYAFVLSPQGNGLDCHRTWEALCLGCIPIVKTSGLDSLFDDLPVWIVEDWTDVTQENMINKIKEFRSKTFKYEKLTLAYWRNILAQ